MTEPTHADDLGQNRKIPAEYQPLLDQVLDRAREVLSAGAELKPCAYLGWAGSGAYTLAPFSTESPEALDAAAGQVRAVAADVRPDAIVILMEAWDAAKALAQGRPAPTQGYADLLLISLETATGYWKADVPITAIPGGRVLGAVEMRAPAAVQGRFVGILKPR
jgi:hypothetical protein